MRTIEVRLYKCSELSEKAKQKAKDDYAINEGYTWGHEAVMSLKKLAEHFGGKVTDWSIDWFDASYSHAEFDMPYDMTVPEIHRRLKELGKYNADTLKGVGDCKLTGVFLDEDAIDGFRISFKSGNIELPSLMQAAFKSLVKAGQSDCEDQYSDETFGENCDANNYEFLASGEIA